MNNTQLTINIIRFEHAEKLELPQYETEEAAGLDLQAAVNEDVIIKPAEVVLVPTGFAIQLPKGYEGQVRPRSGLATKCKITLPNTPGTIDSDYRGEIKVPLINLGNKEFIVKRGMRIAQMIVAPVQQVILNEVRELDESERGEEGFGSTGIMAARKTA